MKEFWYRDFICFIFLCLVTCSCASQEKTGSVSSFELVRSVFDKGVELTDLDFYAGTLMLHGYSEFALLKGNENDLHQVVNLYEKFGSGVIRANGNFISYEAGGSGAPYLAWKGATHELDSQVINTATKMMQFQKRSTEGLMTSKHAKNEKGQVFIDVAFAVTPFLLYAGLLEENQEYIDFAVFETLSLFDILKDSNGLVHQARGFSKSDQISEDNWSRGNGWGAFALAILVRDLPSSHPKRSEVEKLAVDFFSAVVKYQDPKGLWHQEMTDSGSYIETSGSGLMLYGLGIMLEKELMDEKYEENFLRGIRAYTSYIGSDGSISHTCSGCLSPGQGKKKDYVNHPWIYNDPHAFGPAILAFTQAIKLGHASIVPLTRRGEFCIADSPSLPRAYLTLARASDLAWENDRIAFRVFGEESKLKVDNGVDVWVKSVEYPVLDKWFDLSDQGKDYHTDRGEGADLYHMGNRLGCGAYGLWYNDQLYKPDTYDNLHIIKNQPEQIVFALDYNSWTIPDKTFFERTRIKMDKGTNFFEATSTIKCESCDELVVAVGLSTFGNAQFYGDSKLGVMYTWESLGEGNGILGSSVIFNPDQFISFKEFEGDHLVLLKVQANTPFTYKAGAAWSKNEKFDTKEKWKAEVHKEVSKKDYSSVQNSN